MGQRDIANLGTATKLKPIADDEKMQAIAAKSQLSILRAISFTTYTFICTISYRDRAINNTEAFR